MKFCPYCGASLLGSAVSFCSECGKALPSQKGTAHSHQTARRRPSRSASSHKHRKVPQSDNPVKKKRIEQPHIQDESYDGYYDDVPPVDAGQMGEPMDPKLVKQIVLLISGAIGIIIFAVIMMSLL